MQDKPKISIITPSKNTGRFAKETLESILAQTYKNWEHIVVDGMSTDETPDVIRQYPHIRWISEPDSGPDEAFRKGLDSANGEYIMFCCFSDGYLDKNWFQKCVDILEHHHEISLVWGLDQNMLEDGTLHEIVANSWFRNPPANERYFIYDWLENGTLFHERNLCVRKNVIEKCFPVFDIKMLHKQSGFLEFFVAFNISGYLPYFIPNLAGFARIHHNAASQNQAISGELERSLKKYYRQREQYKRKIIKGEIKHRYRDGSGKLLRDGFDLEKYSGLDKEHKFIKAITLFIPPIFVWLKDKSLARYRVYQNMKEIRRDIQNVISTKET